ncbi:MBL fold metallo-hydrolase [Ahrensia sp. R2A130]|uniref:MBL fold metallo-hydrolase n=1 Tax=Ahrensia sp. R2A130 TaxID=744979 RepID=UPI000590F3D6|nr:MBL fold metallo-hydrolase [Ahrensia sp. R2A130]
MNRRKFLYWLGGVPLVGAALGAGSIAVARSKNPYYSGPVSDHFDGTVFFNPEGQEPKGFVELLKWQLNGEKKKWPSSYPSPYNDTPPAKVEGSDLRVSFVGHATTLIQTGGLNILTDPVWSERCSPVSWAGPKRVNAPGIDFDKLPKIDIVLLSHNHYDHLDQRTLDKLQAAHDPWIITPLGNDTIIRGNNENIRCTAHDWGDVVELPNGHKLTLEPAHHWSARGMADRRNALWAAFVIEGPAGKIYHIGDTGFHNGTNYKTAREKYGAFRLAILPFGAYEPRNFMKGQHQNPDEAVQGHKLCNAAHTLGHHWGTFQLTDESIEDQLTHLDEARKKHGVSEDAFRALQPGEFWDVPKTIA